MKRIMYFLSMAAIAVMTVSGCTKYIPFYHNNNGENTENTRPGGGQGGNGSSNEISLKERSDWSITYKGRTDFKEQDGTISRVEEFQFKYTGNAYFIVRTISDRDFKDFYNNSLMDFLKGEVSDVVTTAKNNNQNFYDDVNNVFTSATTTVYFDMIIHGVYTTYMIEVSKSGEITGNYAKLCHTVVEEAAVEEYLRWIGNWHVGDGYSGYDITISACENNYLYYVDGWETGSAVTEQMNQDDWIYARYRKDGNLYFYGQYIRTYHEESLGTDVDEMFVGTYLTDNSDANGNVDVEGADYNYDIAHTAIKGGQVTIEPESIPFDNGFVATYHSMRYSRYCYDEKNWAHYNTSGVPSLPLVMESQPITKAVQGPARRIATKEALRRVRLHTHVSKGQRTFKDD